MTLSSRWTFSLTVTVSINREVVFGEADVYMERKAEDESFLKNCTPPPPRQDCLSGGVLLFLFVCLVCVCVCVSVRARACARIVHACRHSLASMCVCLCSCVCV